MLGYLPGFSDPPAYTERLLAQTGRLAFDVGANAGWVAGKLAERFDEVVAFEPATESFDVLTLTAERHPNITTVNAAISDHTGRVTLRETQVTEKWGELVTGDSMPDWGAFVGHREVSCVTLDDCLLAYGGPDLVKVDTEGHESLVLAGAEETIRDARPTWFVEIHNRFHTPLLGYVFRDYTTEIIRHPGYPEGSAESLNHFYVVATP